MATVNSVDGARQWLLSRIRDETEAITKRSAIVFAPHQDDETLGCGGTIILKSRTATPVSCVFMTDGATSHKALIDENELRKMRRIEALEATAVLGLHPSQVYSLDYPDGRLGSCHHMAVTRVTELLDALTPDEVYVPYRRDGTPDHEATYRIVVDALTKAMPRTTQVLEYPVWFWNRWPWVSMKVSPTRETLATAHGVVRAQFGLELLSGFRSGVFVRNVIDQKRLALDKHRSQMTELRHETRWPTLGRISNGEFLDCCFQDFEIFRRSEARTR